MRIGRLRIEKNPNLKERMVGIIGISICLGMLAMYVAIKYLGWA